MGNSYSSKGPGKVAGAGNNGALGAPGPGNSRETKGAMPKAAYPSRETPAGGTPKGMTSNHKGGVGGAGSKY